MPELNEKTANNNSHKRQIALLIASGIFFCVSLIWFFYWLIWGQFSVYTDDAYVNGNMVQLMSQIEGTVIEVNTDDTQFITEGQTIIKLDPTDKIIALQHAQAALAETVRQVRQIFENAKRAEATLTLRKADLIKATLDLKRREGLTEKSAVSREEYQHYLTAKQTAQAQFDAALHNFQSIQALIENTHLYTHPLVERAKAAFKTAYINAQRTVIMAPVTGYVAKRNVQVGQRIMVNTPMLAIIPLKEIWVDANYKESQLSNLRIGQPVTLYADAHPSIKYHGTVYGLSAGTGAAFSLLPPQNATGNWIKIVQRLPVRIKINAKELEKRPLQLGLSMRVTINTRDTHGEMLAQTTNAQPLYTTNIYAQQNAKAEQFINQILKENSPDLYANFKTQPGEVLK